ncbi:uncharacterized protein BDR25DRAFT_297318 [Lindgomyces ingoldianus]|uniref:Uncharacterized protein n=1 Tax=Lindgomyces ingoldianus TaxID=673940 RepID=A0ACB6QBX1_9PLEO|nr:uncharacterized protein BDR25DRAFT_297318 [Lindgomyces ingoldianus]KAF2463872.1 hypothetical protein BDR25DRAFT_297318 [Lindgomyces ingoldianus]
MTGASFGHELSPEYLAEDKGYVLVTISALFIVVDCIVVTLRIYAQRLNRMPIGLDDILIPCAWLVHIGLCILGIVMVHEAGVGRHLAFVMQTNPKDIVSWVKSIYSLEWLYLPSVAVPKVSILLLYLRLFTGRVERITTHVLIYIVIANWIAYLLASSFQCLPFEYQWNKTIKGGKCFNIPMFYKTVSAPNIATDLVILLLPIRMIVDLKVSTPRKIGLSVIFLSGSVGIIASCFRMAAFFQTEAFVDNTYASVKLVGWSIIEPGMYLVAACSLKFRPVFVALAKVLRIRNVYGSDPYNRFQGTSSHRGVQLKDMPHDHSGSSKINLGLEDVSSTTDIFVSNSNSHCV